MQDKGKLVMLTRRQTLGMIAGAAAFSTLELAGCGGFLKGGGSGGASAFNGRPKVVPVNFLPPAGLSGPFTIKTVLGSRQVSGAGASQATIFDDGPQFTQVVNQSGKTVLAGWITATNSELSVRTTAEVMLFFALNGFLFPDGAKALFLRELRNSADVQPLADAIASALASDPDALVNGNSAINLALQNAKEAFLPANTLGTLVEPAAEKSGIRINQPGGNTIKLANNFRRRAYYYVDRISYVPHDGGPEVADYREIAKGDLSPVAGVSTLFGSIADLLAGNVAYAPTDSDAVSVPLRPTDARRTKYKVTVVGIGVGAGSEADLDADRTSKKRWIIAKSIVVDFLANLIANVLMPLNGDKIDDAMNLTHATDFAEQLVGDLLNALPSAFEKAQNGDVAGALLDLWNDLLTGGPAQVILLEFFYQRYIVRYGTAGSQQTFTEFGESAMDVIGACDIVLTIFDSVIQGIGIGRSNRAEDWSVLATKTRVRLSPEESEIRKTETQTLTATVPDYSGSEQALVYHWSCAGVLGGISDGQHSGSEFESSQKSVAYVPDVSNSHEGTETVSVQAFQIDGQERIPLGSASAKVKVKASHSVELTPATSSVSVGQSRTLSVAVVPDYPNADYLFVYRLSGSGRGTLRHGGQSGALIRTASNQITLESASNDVNGNSYTVSVDAYLDRESPETKIGSDSSVVTVSNSVWADVPHSAVFTTSGSAELGYETQGLEGFERTPQHHYVVGYRGTPYGELGGNVYNWIYFRADDVPPPIATIEGWQWVSFYARNENGEQFVVRSGVFWQRVGDPKLYLWIRNAHWNPAGGNSSNNYHALTFELISLQSEAAAEDYINEIRAYREIVVQNQPIS